MIYQLFNEFQKKIKINDSSLLIFLFKKIYKDQYLDNTKYFISFDYSFHSGYPCHDNYDFLSEKLEQKIFHNA